ncbi:MAG: ABC transporter permease [Candidatus Lernaella stagnicola]|nr:ABC transporter permease [Candidatus Lernaella stagnicola]
MPAGQREKGALIRRLLYVVSPLAAASLWEFVAQMGWIDVRFFPAPSKIVATAVEMMYSTNALTGENAYFAHLTASMSRVFWGTICGFFPGLFIGLTMGLFPNFRSVVSPLVAITYPIPKIAILPLLLMIFGLSEATKIIVIAIGVFFLVLINTLNGVLQIPQIYFEVSEVFKIGVVRRFFRIVLPGAFPFVFTGLRLGVGYGLVLIVAAEFVSKSGLGYLIWESWELFLVERMYVGLVSISLLGYVLNLVLERLEARLVPWAGH